jgi:methionyl aminopeptidase
MKFPKSVCTSVNEVVCHGVPDSYELKKGDIINVDVTVYYGGFHADLNETYFVGGKEAADEDTVRLLQTAYECLFRAIETVKPGQLYRSLGGVIQPHAEANGCSVVRTYMGHGINSLFHTTPLVPHYKANKAVGVMKCGHTFTIEPMLNAGGWKDKMWPDGWTVVTVDGSFSAQFEHTLLVTDEGVEILTARLPSSRADVVVCYRGEVV